MSCGVGCTRTLDLSLLWPWHRPAAVAPMGLLAWEPPYAKKTKKKKKIVNSDIRGDIKVALTCISFFIFGPAHGMQKF